MKKLISVVTVASTLGTSLMGGVTPVLAEDNVENENTITTEGLDEQVVVDEEPTEEVVDEVPVEPVVEEETSEETVIEEESEVPVESEEQPQEPVVDEVVEEPIVNEEVSEVPAEENYDQYPTADEEVSANPEYEVLDYYPEVRIYYTNIDVPDGENCIYFDTTKVVDFDTILGTSVWEQHPEITEVEGYEFAEFGEDYPTLNSSTGEYWMCVYFRPVQESVENEKVYEPSDTEEYTYTYTIRHVVEYGIDENGNDNYIDLKDPETVTFTGNFAIGEDDFDAYLEEHYVKDAPERIGDFIRSEDYIGRSWVQCQVDAGNKPSEVLIYYARDTKIPFTINYVECNTNKVLDTETIIMDYNEFGTDYYDTLKEKSFDNYRFAYSTYNLNQDELYFYTDGEATVYYNLIVYDNVEVRYHDLYTYELLGTDTFNWDSSLNTHIWEQHPEIGSAVENYKLAEVDYGSYVHSPIYDDGTYYFDVYFESTEIKDHTITIHYIDITTDTEIKEQQTVIRETGQALGDVEVPEIEGYTYQQSTYDKYLDINDIHCDMDYYVLYEKQESEAEEQPTEPVDPEKETYTITVEFREDSEERKQLAEPVTLEYKVGENVNIWEQHPEFFDNKSEEYKDNYILPGYSFGMSETTGEAYFGIAGQDITDDMTITLLYGADWNLDLECIDVDTNETITIETVTLPYTWAGNPNVWAEGLELDGYEWLGEEYSECNWERQNVTFYFKSTKEKVDIPEASEGVGEHETNHSAEEVMLLGIDDNGNIDFSDDNVSVVIEDKLLASTFSMGGSPFALMTVSPVTVAKQVTFKSLNENVTNAHLHIDYENGESKCYTLEDGLDELSFVITSKPTQVTLMYDVKEVEAPVVLEKPSIEPEKPSEEESKEEPTETLTKEEKHEQEDKEIIVTGLGTSAVALAIGGGFIALGWKVQNKRK